MRIAQTANSDDRGPVHAASRRSSGRVLMEVKGLRKAFGGQVVLDGVDLELREGEVVLLRGENGSGKTTLLNILTGNMEPDSGEIDLFVNSHPEHFHFPRHWWQNLNPWDHFVPERVASEGVGHTWQDVRLFGSQSLRDNLAVARPDQPGENPWSILLRATLSIQAEAKNRREVGGLLQSLGIGGRGDSSADMISLGQTKRIAFARSVRANTKIIFLDEPLAGLDQQGIENVVAVLLELAATNRLTLVIVEHVFNIPVILDFATAVWTLDDGHLLRESIADVKADQMVPKAGLLPNLIRQMAGPDAVITEEQLPRGATLTRVSRTDAPREPMLTIKGLVARRGHRLVVGEEKNGSITGFDLTVNKGELVMLQAPNGWGKTSLLEALAGILPCEAGGIQLDGESLEDKTIWQRRLAGLAVLPARNNMFNNLSVTEYQRISSTTGNYVENGICYPENRQVSSLSGGERKRLVIGNAHHQSGKVQIWDEPFTSLDENTSKTVCNFLMPKNNSVSLILIPTAHVFSCRGVTK